MTTPITRLTLLLTVLLVCGCSGKPAVPAAGRSAQTTDPPVLTITASPDEEEYLPAGEFVIEGQIEADAGLHATDPLNIAVYDLDTGVETSSSFLGCVTANAEIMTGSYFNTATGEFRIDGEEDFALGAGNIRIVLTAQDTEERTDVWDVEVESGQHWSIPQADLCASRAAWEGRLLEAIEDYLAVLAALEFEAPYLDVELDSDLITALADLLEARIADPDGSDFHEFGYTFEDTVETLLTTAGYSTTDGFGKLVFDGASWERHFNETDHGVIAYDLLRVGREELEVPPTLSAKAFCDHTFVETNSHIYTLPGADPELLAEFRVRIYQDIGAPNGTFDFPQDWDPEGVEPETADPEEPLHDLLIEFRDEDEDGKVDTIEWSGYDVVPETNSTEPITTTDDEGHTLVPLMPFWMSRHHFRVAI